MPLSPGHHLGSYEIIASLGAGGMGEVYRARDARLGRDVALKILPPEVTGQPGRLERFDREARAIAALNHPHIVTIYSTEEAEGIRFLTMELVDGCTLSDLVTSSGMAMPRFLEIAIPLADALAAAHQKQITHRDLKPGNVMVSSDNRVKVLDFGLARLGDSDPGGQTLIATQAPITHQGMIVGTMPYMSPEQVEGRPVDARSDLFSLGVIFYELLGGQRPFKGSSSPALMSAILRDTPPAIGETRSDVPDAIERLIARLLEKRPEDRIQTARDVYNELRHAQKRADNGQARPTSSPGAGAALQNMWIAVLPFAVRGSDPDADAMAVALTDDIAASIARFPGFSVVATQSTRVFKDSPLDVRQIAERLHARYVITGNVRKSGPTLRTVAQVIDAASGQQLWTETYDRRLDEADLFAIQDDVTDHIVATVADKYGVLSRAMVGLVAAQAIPGSTAHHLLIHGWGFQQRPVAGVHAELRTALEARLEIEPNDANLWGELANMYIVEHSLWFNPLPDSLERAQRAARRAIEIDRAAQTGWLWLAMTHFHHRDRAGFEEACARTIAINPRNAYALAWMGNALTHMGEYERGCRLTERAMAINPLHPGWLHFAVFNRHFAAGAFDEALRAARRVNMREFFWMHFAIAAACGQLGLREGKAAAEEMARLAPFPVASTLPEFVSRWYWPEDMARALLDGVGKAQADDRRDAGSVTPAPGSMSHAGPHAKPPSSTSGMTRGGALSVAVLPFVPRSSDDESKSLADGLTDDITSGLSRFGYLRVLSRSTVERLAREQSAVQTQARYAVEGHVRKAGSTIRVGVTLVDTESGANLWTHTFDRDATAGVFSLQDEMAGTAVATIGDQTGALVRAMAASIAGTPSDQLTVAELVVRYHIYAESFRPDEHAALRAAFERALEREPRAAEGWGCLAMLYEHEHGFGLNPQPDPLGRQRRAAERAVELDPLSQQAWIAMASVHLFGRDREGLNAAAERAVSINPLNADLVALAGVFLSLSGQYERAVTLVQQAVARKAHHPGWYHFPMFNDYFCRGNYEAALREVKATNMPKMVPLQFAGAAVSGHLGRTQEARTALAALRSIDPALVEPDNARRFWALSLWDEAFKEQLLEGFKKALEITKVQQSDPSIAVLPFTDLSEKKDQDWFCDGIAEELLNALASLPGLRVAARASAFSFRGKTEDLRVIGEKLNVTTVLEGSVRRAGDRVRITTQLSDTREGRQLWSERFDRELKDIFDVQEEIARAIAERLRITIAGGSGRLVQQATTNMEAYQLLLQGRALVTRRGRAVLDAIPLFERAIALDPNLSEAHALLGDAYRLLGLYGIARAGEVMPKAWACIDRALAIDPTQPEALASLSIQATIYNWDLADMYRRSDRALAADPTHVRALTERAFGVAAMAQPGPAWHADAVGYLNRARALDPLNVWVRALEAGSYALMGRADEAVDMARAALQLDSSNFTAHWIYAWVLAEAGREDESLAASVPALAMSGRHTMILTNMTAIYSARGESAKVEAIRQELAERAQTSFIGDGALATVAAAAGRWEEARDFLAKAIAERDPWLTFWKFYAWRPVWNDEQCAAMIRATSLFAHFTDQ